MGYSCSCSVVEIGKGAGGNYVGGLLGWNNGSMNLTIKDCMNTGNITVGYHTYVGSIAGRFTGDKSNIVLENTYTLQDSYLKNGIATPYNKLAELELDGGVVLYPKEFITGYNGFKYTNLDFKTYWAAVNNNTPVLKSFTDKSLNVAGLQKVIDTSWYKKDAKSYTIDTASKLFGLYVVSCYDNFKGKTVKLGKDIQLNTVDEAILETWKSGATVPEKVWLPIGSKNFPFEGTFDGQGYTVRGLYMNIDQSYNGFFGYANTGSMIKNLSVKDSCLYLMNSPEFSGIGGIIGESRGDLDTIYSEVDIVTNGIQVGGVVGRYVYADKEYQKPMTINNCWYNGQLVMKEDSRQGAGIVSTLMLATGIEPEKALYNIKNCFNTGSISNERTSSNSSKDASKSLGGQYIGGILGWNNGTVRVNISSCLNTGNIDVKYKTYVGSVVGRMNKDTSVFVVSDTYTTEEAFKNAQNMSTAYTNAGVKLTGGVTMYRLFRR